MLPARREDEAPKLPVLQVLGDVHRKGSVDSAARVGLAVVRGAGGHPLVEPADSEDVGIRAGQGLAA